MFVLATNDDPVHQHYLNLYKLGEGPLYCFYTPYHLCHFEVHNSIVRMVDFADVPVVPIGGPVVEVVADRQDRPSPPATPARRARRLPHLRRVGEPPDRPGRGPAADRDGRRGSHPRAIAKDAAITFDDVELPPRLINDLFDEQVKHFGITS